MRVAVFPDDYEFMDAHLQEMRRLTLDPELAAFIAAQGEG